MRLDEFYRAAERRANELGIKYWSVEARLTMSLGRRGAEYTIYMPGAADGRQSAETPEGALDKIGAEPCFEDSTELPHNRSGTG